MKKFSLILLLAFFYFSNVFASESQKKSKEPLDIDTLLSIYNATKAIPNLSFNNNTSYTTIALGLNLGLYTNEPKPSPIQISPGFFLSINSFKQDKKIGFHFDTEFLLSLPETNNDDSKISKKDSDDFSLGFSLAFLLGPSFRFGNQTKIFLSPGISTGLILGFGTSYKTNIGKPVDNTFFQYFLGIGGNFTCVFKSGFSIIVPLAFYPLNYSYSKEYIYKEKKTLDESSYFNGKVKFGLFLGITL